MRYVLVALLAVTACGKSKTCTSANVDSCEDFSSLKLGDDCETFDDQTWLVIEEKGYAVAARCVNGQLGSNKKDRLRCTRSGYEIQLSNDDKYAYCRNNQNFISFLYDQTFGAHKPWRCDVSSAEVFYGVNDKDETLEFVCNDGLLVAKSAVDEGQMDSEIFDPESGVPTSCTSSSSTVLFSPMALEDFDPEVEVVETFKPSDSCKQPTTPTTDTVTKPDDVSGAHLSH